MLFGGSLIFAGVFLLQATAAFWTIEALEVASIFTHGIRVHPLYLTGI